VPYYRVVHPWMAATLQVIAPSQDRIDNNIGNAITTTNTIVNQEPLLQSISKDLLLLRIQQNQQQKGP
jgi:hypothetical protein